MKGISWSRPVVGDQPVGVEAELVERPLLELLDPHPLLGAGHLVAVHGVDQLVEVAAQVAHLLARLAQLLLAPGPPLLDARAFGSGQGHGLLEPRQHPRGAAADGLAHAPLVEQLLAAGDRCRPSLALGPGGPEQRVGAAVQGAGPLLGRAQGEPRVHLGGPRDARLLGEALAVGGGGLLLGRVLRA